MIKINRIGNKLGLAGLFGILLAGGMLVNQMMSGSAVKQANQRADAQETIANHALEGNVGLRRMQLAVRDIRLSTTPTDLQTNAKGLDEAYALTKKQLDIAISRVVRPENKERLVKIESLAGEYNKAASELVQAQAKIFDLVQKRNALSENWTKTFDTVLASSALAAAANRTEIEKALFEADSMFNAMRAATWRFASSGDESQKTAIETRNAGLTGALARVRNIVSGSKELQTAADTFATSARGFAAATAETIKLEASKKDLVEVQTVPRASQAIGLMRTAVDTAEKLAADAKAVAAAELSQANSAAFVAATAVILSLIGSVIFTFVGVARPLTLLNGALLRLAGGELNIKIPGSNRGDEVGDIAKTVVVIGQNAEQKARDEAEAQARQEQDAAKRRKADMIKMADDFEGAIGEIVETVSSASTELEASAGTLTATAERAQELTAAVAAASEEASTNVQSVASATEELTGSVNEISRQVQEFGANGQRGRRPGAQDQRPGFRTVAGRRADRRRGRTHQHHRRPDQPVGPECHHRSGQGGRGRPRLCGRGLRGESSRRADGQGYRRNRPADRQHPGGHERIGRRHQGDQRHHREALGNLRHDRLGRRGAGRRDAGNFT